VTAGAHGVRKAEPGVTRAAHGVRKAEPGVTRAAHRVRGFAGLTSSHAIIGTSCTFYGGSVRAYLGTMLRICWVRSI